MAKASELRHLDTLKAEIGRKFMNWRKWNSTATLGELLQFLEQAQDELLSFNGDDLLMEIEGELSDADYLATWEQQTGYMDGEEFRRRLPSCQRRGRHRRS